MNEMIRMILKKNCKGDRTSDFFCNIVKNLKFEWTFDPYEIFTPESIYIPEQQLYRTFSLFFPWADEETVIILSKMSPFCIPSGFSQTTQKMGGIWISFQRFISRLDNYIQCHEARKYSQSAFCGLYEYN